MAFDFKKEYKEYYLPKNKSSIVGRKVVEMVTKEKVTYQDNTDRKATAELLKAVKALK